MYYVSRIAGGIVLIALGCAVWFSIVLARADTYFRAATPQSVARAVQIAPRNTEYLSLRALQLEYDGEDPSELRKQMIALNPYSSAPRIQLGLSAEMSGDPAPAERWLLEAASVDHQFEPRWTLANFYFRAGNPSEFWKWMRAALDVSYGDRTPAFDLCWRVSQDAQEILRSALPARHELMAAYLIYLSQTNRLAAMPAVAKKLAAYRDPSDRPLLLGACDQLLAASDPAALDVWVLAGNPAPKGIFNGDFLAAPINHGFDWYAEESAGVTHTNLTAAHRIALSGQQPESCPLLKQILALGNGKQYRLSWEARTTGIPAGLQWRIAGRHAELLPSSDWTPGTWDIVAPAAFAPLELIYQRPLGEPRAEGTIEIRNVRLIEAGR